MKVHWTDTAIGTPKVFMPTSGKVRQSMRRELLTV